MKRIAALVVVVAGCAVPPLSEPVTTTFSIVAFDPETKDFGVAVCTMPPKVGNIVPWAKAEVGAVATQAMTNGGFGPRGLEMLAAGKSAKEALETLVADDPGKEQRQIGVIDSKGEAAAFTGSKCMPWCGSKQGKNYSCQGNLLVSEETVAAMAKAFEDSAGKRLGERLMLAVGAGHRAGGDKRGHSSAALIVVRKDAEGMKGYDRLVDVRVDDHAAPIKELRRLFDGRRSPRLGDRLISRPRGRDVMELSKKLKEAGLLEEEGDLFTDKVAEAVAKLRKEAGLKEGDLVDEALLKALEEKLKK